ncbi:hypothetical protein Cgig2_022622 [Carnegiea gigantea]|uniref:Transposase n=1 Tax=Carnegiea gigantea TaxID=171969 RepID=A0A9Q1JY22_9CARY|nr:hypothetical protein Cgig2_022622 [Carnegiea gigantea]
MMIDAYTVFYNDDMEVYREHVLEHMHVLWTNWRADLKRYNITKPGRSLRQALDHVPSGLDKYEWEWLVKEIYSKDPHKKASARNSANRSYYKKDRLHRTGSKPYRQVAWELDEIRDVMEKDPSLSQMEVLGLGGGVKPKDVRGSYSTRAELEVELNVTRRKNEVLIDHLATVEAENEKLQNRVEPVETEMMKIKDLVFQQFNTRPPSTACDGHETRGT